VSVMGSVIAHTHAVCAAKARVVTTGSEDAELASTQTNEQQLRRVRDSLLDMLVERTYDVSSYTRAVVLKTWSVLVEAGALPVVRIDAVAEVAADRLQDRVAAVRKAAMALIIALVDNNPFAVTLQKEQFVTRKSELEAALASRRAALGEQLKAEIAASAAPAALSQKEEDEQQEEEEGGGVDQDEDAPEQLEVAEDSEVVGFRNDISFCGAAVRFIAVIEGGMPRVMRLTHSKTSSDVVEALRVIGRAVVFKLNGAAAAFQQSLSLVWHQDDSIKAECRAVFVSVYLSDGAVGVEPTILPAPVVAANLVDICVKCDVSEKASLEKIVGELFAEKVLASDVVLALWQSVTRYLIH
jgi:condensin complex subunit 1